MFAGQPRIISSNYLEDEKYNPGVVLSRPRDATAAAVQRLRCRVADGLLLPRPEVLVSDYGAASYLEPSPSRSDLLRAFYEDEHEEDSEEEDY